MCVCACFIVRKSLLKCANSRMCKEKHVIRRVLNHFRLLWLRKVTIKIHNWDLERILKLIRIQSGLKILLNKYI